MEERVHKMNQKQLKRKQELESYVKKHNESVRAQDIESFKIQCQLCQRTFSAGDDMDCDNVRMERHNKKYHNGLRLQDAQFMGL